MNRIDLKELSMYVTTPCLSMFIAHTHETRPIEKIKKALIDAEKTVYAPYPTIDKNFMPELHIVQSQIDLESSFYHGIAIFINRYIIRAYMLPFPVEDRNIFDMHFALPIVSKKLNRLIRFWLLAIHNNVPYLFEGYENALIEVIHKHTTWRGEETNSIQDLAGKTCTVPLQQWGNTCRYATPEEFIIKIDEYMHTFMEDDPLPLILFANQQDKEHFASHSRYAKESLYRISDSFLTPTALLSSAWPTISNFYMKNKRTCLERLQEARKAGLCLTSPEEIWHKLHEDEIRLIGVEKDFHVSACEDTAHATILEKKTCGTLVEIDAIDEILESAAHRRIPVVLYNSNELKEFHGIAAVQGSADFA